MLLTLFVLILLPVHPSSCWHQSGEVEENHVLFFSLYTLRSVAGREICGREQSKIATPRVLALNEAIFPLFFF